MKSFHELTLLQELGTHNNPEQILEFLDILTENHTKPKAVENLKQLLEDPPPNDTKLQTIYKTPFVTGDIVAAGTQTQKNHPLTYFHPIHFKKSYLQKLSRWETDPAHEARTSQHIWEHFQDSPLPKTSPLPLGASPLIYRSQLLPAKTLGTLSPVSIPQKHEDTAKQILHARKQNPYLKTLWNGCEQLHEAIQTFHNGGFLHHDLHRENLMIELTTPTPTAHIIDFETAEEDDRFQTLEWNRACLEDKALFLQEASLLYLCLPKSIQPPPSKLTQLVQSTLQSNPMLLSVQKKLQDIEKSPQKSLT